MRRVLGLPVYRRLLLAYGLNELAWSVGTLALSVLVYRRTGSALGATGFFLCSQVLPAFVSPMLVARLDRKPTRRLLPALYALEGVVFGVLAWMTSRFSLAPVLVLALADGVFAIVARTFARSATVAELAPADLLPEGNALTNGVFSVCFMAGPVIGGAVVAAGGTVAALLANCGLFAAVAVVLMTTRLPAPPVEDDELMGGRLRAALTHVRGTPALIRLLSLQAVGMVFFTISIPVEVVFAQRSIHSGAAGYGALMSAWGVGAVAGSAMYARWRRQPARVLIASSAGALACGLGLMAAAPTLAIALAGAVLGGASNGVEMVAARTAVQERTEQRWMAMVMGLVESVAQATPGLGILLGGVIAALADPRAALAVAAAGSLVFTIAAWVVLRPSALEPAERAPTEPPGREGSGPPRRGGSEPARALSPTAAKKY